MRNVTYFFALLQAAKIKRCPNQGSTLVGLPRPAACPPSLRASRATAAARATGAPPSSVEPGRRRRSRAAPAKAQLACAGVWRARRGRRAARARPRLSNRRVRPRGEGIEREGGAAFSKPQPDAPPDGAGPARWPGRRRRARAAPAKPRARESGGQGVAAGPRLAAPAHSAHTRTGGDGGGSGGKPLCY